MSREHEYWVERKMIVKHEIAKLQARSLYGDDPPSAEEWGAAFKAVRDTTFEAAMDLMKESMPPPMPANQHQSVPGRMTFTVLERK